MASRKNKIKRNPAAEAVAKSIIENYKPETVFVNLKKVHFK